MEKYVGIYYILYALTSYGIFAILWFEIEGVIHTLRDTQERLGYWVSYSAKFGIPIVIASVLVAQSIIQRGGAHVLWPFNSWLAQTVILLACFAVGLCFSYKTYGKRSGEAADIYHDVFAGPVNMFLAFTLLPFVACNGRWYDDLFLACAVALWVVLLRVDIKGRRLNQRRWLVNHGFRIRGRIPEE